MCPLCLILLRYPFSPLPLYLSHWPSLTFCLSPPPAMCPLCLILLHYPFFPPLHSLSFALPKPSLSTLSPPSLLLFVYLHPLYVSSLLDSSLHYPFSPPPPHLSLIAPPRPSLSTLSHFEVLLSSPLLTVL